MSTRTRTSRATDQRMYGRHGGYGEYYIDGSTARRIDVRKAIQELPEERVGQEVHRRPQKTVGMNLSYVAFMVVAFCTAAMVLIGYIRIQAENTAMLENIARKESRLNSLRLANDEEYSRIVSSVDLEYVKDVAINQLGMKYAEEGQIVEVQVQGDDYVRQYQEMP